MNDKERALDRAYAEYKSIEPKQPELKQSPYKEPEAWKSAAAGAIGVLAIILSVALIVLGFIGLVLTVLAGVDGDGYSASLGIWSLVFLALGGGGFLFGWTFWRISKS